MQYPIKTTLLRVLLRKAASLLSNKARILIRSANAKYTISTPHHTTTHRTYGNLQTVDGGESVCVGAILVVVVVVVS